MSSGPVRGTTKSDETWASSGSSAHTWEPTFSRASVFQFRQCATQFGNRLPVQPFGRDQNLGIAALQPLADRLRTERREEWTEDTGVFERAQRRSVESWNSTCQCEYAILFANAQPSQHVRKAIRLLP